MKTVAFSLIVLGLALASVPAQAQGQTTFTLETHTEGGGGYFTLEGQTARNPTLSVTPGAEITVTIKGMDSGVHNFCAGTNDKCTTEYVTAAGETQTITFTAPATGTIAYYCLPHKSLGMTGTISAASTNGTPTDNGNDDSKDSPGLGVLGVALAGIGAALLVTRRK